MTTVATAGWVRTRRRQIAKHPKVALVIYAVLFLILLTVIFGPLVAPASVNTSNILEALQPPSAQHWLGTDQQGRDVLWRVVVGARASVASAVLIVIGFSLIGVLVATLATAFGRAVDEVVMRVVDSVMSIPPIIFALGVAAALGPSLKSAIIAQTLTGWPYTARLLRGIMRQTAASDFVEGARLLGSSRLRVMARHVLPNSLDVMVVKWAGDMGNTILVLGALSFVGVGAQPPSAEWGAAITAAKGDLSVAWWPALAPGVAIAVTAIAFGLLGDSLQRHFNADLV
ncbi:ABC transporter permease [Kribbella sp. NPDC059898]|uniref:ABC transporter permease n=1 Tax=Kribbella sp. NPDC059898 TaxID=3346995 RepID=UPI00364C9DC5